MSKNITDRYAYLTDKDQYYDRTRREYFAESTFINKLKYALGSEFTLEKVIQIQKLVRDFGVHSDSLAQKGRPPKMTELRRDALEAAYLKIRDKLNLFRHYDGLVTVLYKSDPLQQLSYIGNAEMDAFKEYVTGTPELLAHFMEAFNSEDAAPIHGTHNKLEFIGEMYDAFLLDPSNLLKQAPELLAWDSGPAFRVLSSAAIKPGPTPTWDQFLSRVTEPETFKAYIWSIFEPTNFGRQALWLQGEGGDGKSTVLRALADFMGNKHTLTIGIGSYDKDFFFGEAFGKRLAIYPDCKNLQVLRKERIKQLLGRDIVPINNKYEKVFSAQIYGKLLVASNWMPQINYSDASERTRLLVCTVRSYGDEMGDPDFQEKLTEELPSFLLLCKSSYEAECPRGMNLRVPPNMQEIIKTQCSAIDADLLEEFYETCIETGPGLSVHKTSLHYALKHFFSTYYAGQSSHFSFNDLTRKLGLKGIKAEQTKSGTKYLGIRVKTEFRQTMREVKNEK